LVRRSTRAGFGLPVIAELQQCGQVPALQLLPCPLKPDHDALPTNDAT
jgi:hypothetical protein